MRGRRRGEQRAGVVNTVRGLLPRVHEVWMRARQALQLAVAARLLLAVLTAQRAAGPLQRVVLLLGGAVSAL